MRYSVNPTRSGMRLLSGFLLLMYWVGPCHAVDETAAKNSALSFFRKVPNIVEEELSNLHMVQSAGRAEQYRWTGLTGKHDVSVDDRTGKVTRYSSLDIENQIGGLDSVAAGKGRPFFNSELSAISYARDKLDEFGWGAFEVARLKEPLEQVDAEGQVKRAHVWVLFSEAPNGFPAGNYGNSAEIGFDSLSGEIASMRRRIGISYEEVSVRLSPAQALNAARQVVQVGEDVFAKGPSYVEFSSFSNLPQRARNLANARKCGLVYSVRGKKFDVFVAADTAKQCCSSKTHQVREQPSDQRWDRPWFQNVSIRMNRKQRSRLLDHHKFGFGQFLY